MELPLTFEGRNSESYMTREQRLVFDRHMLQLKIQLRVMTGRYRPFIWHIASIEKAIQILKETRAELVALEAQTRIEMEENQ